MSTSAFVLLVCYGVIVTVWKVLHVMLLFYKPKRFFLGAQAPRLTDGPLVSILLAAKDEQGNVGDCIRSILAAEYKNFELIVIDDRSSDGTFAEAEQAAAGDPRVRLLRVRELPDGWTGKMNAVQQGLAVARGELLLLVDADSRHTPQTLGAALHVQKRRNLDLLSLLPRFDHHGLFSKLVQPLVGVVTFLWKPLPLVNSRHCRGVAMGWGGFLLLRRPALEAVGGFEAVRDRFAADIALVRLFKRSGRRVRLLHAPELVATSMYTSFPALVAGWSRILRITVDNRALLLVATLLLIWLFGLSAYAATGVGLVELIRGKGRPLRLLLGTMGVMHLVFQISCLGRIYRFSGTNPLYALGHLPALLFTAFLTVLALVRSRSSRMTWRGTSYRLSADGRALG
ncbi:MAG TPA: glycosyltransferase family 2 protein [Gemmataceae bacterium]|nr:glycosyltransferase family 2 protein [Gemmataceae bacterium]